MVFNIDNTNVFHGDGDPSELKIGTKHDVCEVATENITNGKVLGTSSWDYR